MTAYRNFIQDYPIRCRRLLSIYFKGARENNLEVTLLLNIASSGLIVPYARLSEGAHPSGDSAHFKGAKDNLDKILNAPFLSSELHPKKEPQSWRLGKLKELSGDPDSWQLDQMKPITKKKTARPLVQILRNALAHGNIFIRGNPHIETLVFLSRIKCVEDIGYNCLTVSPPDLKEFVLCWLQTLSNAKIPGQVFMEGNLFAEHVA